MAFIQRTPPPPNKIHTFSLHNFVGGINNRSELLAPNEATDLMNMSFTNDTIMDRRLGYTTYDSFNPGVVTMMKEFRPYTEPDEFIRATNSVIYSGTTRISDVSGKVHSTNYMGKFFFLDGQKIRVYGKFPQTGSTYVKVNGTAVDSNLVMEVVSPPEGFTPLASPHKEGVTVYDYTGNKVWYEPCQFEIDDPFKGSNVVPEKPKYIVPHNDRLYMSGSNRDDDNVFISDVSNPFYFPVYLPIQLPPNSDKVRGLYVFDNSVVVGREDDIYVIEGDTNRTDMGVPVMRLRKLNSHTGIANQDSMDVAHNFLFFLGSDGVVYALASTNYDEKTLATRIISRQLDLFVKPFNFNKEDFTNSCSVFYKNEWYLSIKDLTLVYNYNMQAWTIYNNMNARSFYSFFDQLVWGDDEGRTGTFGNKYLDFDVPYRCFWKSKRFDMEDSSIYKHFREFYLVAFTYENVTSDIRVSFEVDYQFVKSEMFVDNKISYFGKTKWGERFIHWNINQSAPFIIGQRGRLIAFQFENGYDPSEPVETVEDLKYYVGRSEGTLVWVNAEDKYYLYSAKDLQWYPKELTFFNQGMKVYQMNGDYEFRGKR